MYKIQTHTNTHTYSCTHEYVHDYEYEYEYNINTHRFQFYESIHDVIVLEGCMAWAASKVAGFAAPALAQDIEVGRAGPAAVA